MRLMYRRERALEFNGGEPELYRDSMNAPPKPLSSYCLHLKFHLGRDGRSVAVVSKFVDEMEFGGRMDESRFDAMRFTLDVYPKLREYNYDSISISCDLVQRLTNKRCPLLPRGCLDYKFEFYGNYVPGEYWLETNGDNGITISGEYFETLLYMKARQGECPCTCGGWVSDPDDEKDTDFSMLQKFCLIQPHCTCDWAKEEWKAFRLLEFELFFQEYEYFSEHREDLTAEEQLEKMNQFVFI